MSSRGCLDDGCRGCLCDEDCCAGMRQHRNMFASGLAGLLFAAGWWVMIDAAAVDNVENKHQAIGVMSTVGLFMVNAISAERINDSGIYTDGCLGGTAAKIWLLFGMIISFGSLAAAIWVMVAPYLNEHHVYPGIAVFMQNLLIFFSMVLFKFGRGDSSEWGVI